MSTVKVCYKCKFEGVTESSRCPRCGRLLRSKVAIRVTGALMTLVGGFLMAMMAGLILWALNAYRETGTAAARFTGTPEQFLMIIGLFGLIFVFGLLSAVVGLWQLILGRRNMILVWVIVGLGAFLVIAGIVVTSAL